MSMLLHTLLFTYNNLKYFSKARLIPIFLQETLIFLVHNDLLFLWNFIILTI